MALSFLVPNRTVLLLSDEALYIYVCGHRGVRLKETVPWEADNFEKNVARIIARDCKGKPVVILNDMVEQHYRKERIIRKRIGIMDKTSIVKRKLNFAFPNYSVRAAYALKEKVRPADKDGTDLYIFAAIPDSKQFQKLMTAVDLSLAPIVGLYLLPVEASDMVKTLSAELIDKNKTKAEWVVFVGQHRSGGLRQIVVKSGQLALTRMTPIMDNDNNAQSWGEEVYQEFNATMSYLSRFGFQPEDGLHVIAIANPESGEVLRGLVQDSFVFSSLTAAEAAKTLNLALGPQEDVRYSDGLHIAWAGRKQKFILPMKSAKIERIRQPRLAARVASFAFIIGAIFLAFQLVRQSSTLHGQGQEIVAAQQNLSQLNVQYQKEVQRKDALGFDVRLVQSSIIVYNTLEKNNIHPLSILQSVGQALSPNMRVDKIQIKKSENTVVASLVPDLASKPPAYTAVMQMTYPSSADIDKGNQDVKDLQHRLQILLPQHIVEITKLLKDYQYSEGIVVETGNLAKQNVSQDFVAEITIKGPPLHD
jgi:hypothetical protein